MQLGLIGMIILIVSVLAFLVIAFFVGIAYRKKIAESEIKSAEEQAKKIINDAIKASEAKKREALVEAKEEIHRNRSELDKEIKERRAELQKQENRIDQKEQNLDKKFDAFEKKEEMLAEKIKKIEEMQEEVNALKKGQMDMLERISGYTVEEAKLDLIRNLESEVRHEYAIRIAAIDAKYKEEAEERAREYISQAISRCAADHTAEVTVSVVLLPNDEIKGRIIGREGRNIRTLETLTGVDLIIDDTPEAITLSSFDPIRRETARIALEKLLTDGRIHPARIEETVEKAKKDIEATIRKEGERATFETGVHGMNGELVKILGRMRYRTSYGQNVLNHSIEVSHISGLLAAELGVDVGLAKRAGLLHDIGKAIDHEVEGSHVSIGVDLAKKYRENEEVIHAIHAHHGDVEAKTVIACIVAAADAISAARPGARRENFENYIKRLEKLEELATSMPGVERSFAIQAGREIRIIVKPEEVNDDELVLLSRDIANKIENELEYPGQIKVHLVRETRAIEIAK